MRFIISEIQEPLWRWFFQRIPSSHDWIAIVAASLFIHLWSQCLAIWPLLKLFKSLIIITKETRHWPATVTMTLQLSKFRRCSTWASVNQQTWTWWDLFFLHLLWFQALTKYGAEGLRLLLREMEKVPISKLGYVFFNSLISWFFPVFSLFNIVQFKNEGCRSTSTLSR